MGATVNAANVWKSNAVYISLLIMLAVNFAEGNSWSLCFREEESLKFEYNRKIFTDDGEENKNKVHYLNTTCGCSLEHNEFSLRIQCDARNQNTSLEMSALLCPHNLQLSYQRHGATNMSIEPFKSNGEGAKRSSLTARHFIPDELVDVVILTLLLILLAALATITTLACVYCRLKSKLAGVLEENRIIHYAAESVGSFAANEIRVLEISEPITDKLVKFEENSEVPITHAKISTSVSEEHFYHSVLDRKSTCV